MTRKRFFLLLLILILLSVSFVACSSQIKAFSKDPGLIATKTPFQSIATYTNTPTPLTSVGDALASDSGPTLTPDGEDGESVEGEGEEPTPEASQEGGVADPTATLDPGNDHDGSTSTNAPDPTKTPRPSATLKPYQPQPKTNTPIPPADTNTPIPAGDTNTPVPGNDTDTPAPPADTNTPVPPADTNTPVPPSRTPTDVPPPTSAACVYSGNSGYESQVIILINQERAAEGLSALTQNSKLTLAARRHSQDMACNDNWSHTGTDGSTLGSRLLAAGYSYSWAGENIATSSSQYFSASSVVNMWMNSPPHRANILNPNFVHIGVGFRYADDVTIGDWGVYDAYYTADFAAP